MRCLVLSVSLSGYKYLVLGLTGWVCSITQKQQVAKWDCTMYGLATNGYKLHFVSINIESHVCPALHFPSKAERD